MKCVIILALVGLSYAAPPPTPVADPNAVETVNTETVPAADEPKIFVSPWFSTVSTDGNQVMSSPWFSSVSTDGSKQIASPWFSSVTVDGSKQISSPWFSSSIGADGIKQISTPMFSLNKDGSTQISTPMFSMVKDGSKQISTPFFAAQIPNPADPFQPASFQIRTPFGVQAISKTAPKPSFFDEIQEQANLEQQLALQKLTTLVGQENVEILFKTLVGQYPKVAPWQYQNFVHLLQEVGLVKVQELLNTFAGEKLTFPTQYGQIVVKLKQVVLDKILDQLKKQVDVYESENQYKRQYPAEQTQYGKIPYTQVEQTYPYQYQPSQYPYGQQESQYPNQYVQQYGHEQNTMADSYHPLAQSYQQTQYYPYQQYAQGFQNYQPNFVPAY